MMPTKEQERKALEKIQKILAELGGDPETSYVVRAFEGCAADAESNIENDFGDSWKQRAESRQKDAEEFKRAAEYYAAEAEKAQKEAETLREKVLTTAEAGEIKAMLNSVRMNAAATADEAAERIVKNADDPCSNEFKEAVRDNRAGKKRAEDCERLIQRLLETMSA